MSEALWNPNVEAEYRKEYKVVKCPNCGTYSNVGNKTIYYKCAECGEGVFLENEEARLAYKEPMVIVDFGKTGDSMWVEVQDSDGNIHTYWKER